MFMDSKQILNVGHQSVYTIQSCTLSFILSVSRSHMLAYTWKSYVCVCVCDDNICEYL
uniref:Uncharacterized protein n=1 Tax=Octopus bimaculoides TaxID=37653 RepID=A0A0L8HK76_OCTBM